MSYTVLARKYRSRNFDEIVGQDAIATTLRNAIRSGRVHHGYLFTGTRGVGKTSMARILARALNCMSADDATTDPCGECESCRAVGQGEDVDVVEIDAASNTGVDNIRDLIANVAYRPARARYKIYIIDEVHMLSTGAFNALLKTLEEPPEHVKFIFATTSPQKVPATILSRVQRFDFRAISADRIAQQLQTILKAEGVTADDAVVKRVARQANGSMRDALSLLDQLLSLGVERLTPELIEEVLPARYDADVADMIGSFSEGDAAAALKSLDQILACGYTLERFAESMIDQLRSLMLIRICGADSDLVDLPANARDQALEQSARFEPAQFVYMIALLEELRRNIRFNGAARALADAAVVRLSQAAKFGRIEELLARLGDGSASGTTPNSKTSAKKKETENPPATVTPRHNKDAPPETRAAPAQPANPPRNRSARTSSTHLAAARAEPMVQYAVELFDGILSNVEPIASDSPPVAGTDEQH